MGRTKVQVPMPSRMEKAALPILRAASGPKPAKPVAKAAPSPVAMQAGEVNHTPDFVAAGVVPFGKPVAAGRVELVGPGANYVPPAGYGLRCFLHRDGTGVKFAGDAGDIFVDRTNARSEFGTLLASATVLLASNPAPNRAPAKAATPVRRAAEGTSAPAGDAASAVATASRSSGTPLASSSRSKLESSYGADLGQVRVHTDTAASDAARSVQAHAFTAGQDIFFQAGRYNPGTAAGDKLLAHEVAHTVQQQSSVASIARQPESPELQISEPGDRVEREAEAAADRAVQGQPAALRSGATGIARLAENPPAAPPPAAPKVPAKPPEAKKPEKAEEKPVAAPNDPAAKSPGGPPPAAEKKAPGPAAKEPARDGKEPAAEKGGKPEAPASQEDGLQAVVAAVAAAGAEQKTHESAEKKAGEAQTSVGVTPDQTKLEGQQNQVAGMAGQETKKFDREAFKTALRAKIVELQAADAKNIKDGDKAQGINDAVKGEVAKGKQESAGGIAAAAQQPPSGGTPQAAGPEVPAAKPGAAPSVDGSKAVPAKASDDKVSMAAPSQALDEQMAANKVTPEQLHKANEPTFAAAADAKTAAQTQADAMPAQARANEQNVLTKSKGEAATITAGGLGDMHGKRSELMTATRGQQTDGKGKHEEVKKKLAEKFDAIYTRTNDGVTKRLAKLDEDVAKTFDEGASTAKTKLYLFIGAKLLIYYAGGGWLVDAFTEGNDRDKIFEEGRRDYLADMEKVIDQVASVVEKGLEEVVALIKAGKDELDAEIVKLPEEDKAVAREVAQGVQGKFAELEQNVEAKQKEIIDSVAAKYVAAQKEIDDAINILKDPVGAAINYAKETIAGVLETLAQMKALLLGVLAKAAEAIDLIIADPIGFVGNLAAGVKQGLLNFVGNIGTHLQKGLFDWLFGTLAKAGIQIPDRFDLSGIMSIVLQVLGLTWTNIRKRAVAILGDKVVAALETASEIIVTLVTKGPAGLWEYIKDKASDLIQSVLDGIKSFLIEKVIMAGVTWIIGLLNPASAFIKACKAIVDIVSWIMANGQQILEFVNAVLDSVLSIAKGNIAPAAAAVEKALAKAVPVAIGFLAGLLGLGGLSDKIKAIIDKIQAPINAAIDWIIKKAVQLAKAVGKMFGGKEDKPDERTPVEKEADRDKALAAAEKVFLDKDLDADEITKRLAKLQKTHRVARLELVSDGKSAEGESVHVLAENSPPITGKTHVIIDVDIPSNEAEFDAWFMAASDELLDAIWKDKKLHKKVATLLRGTPGQHEFLTVGMARKWRKWGITPSEARQAFSVAIRTVNTSLAKGWKHSTGGKAKAPNSGKVHNDLEDIIRVSRGLDDFWRLFEVFAEVWLDPAADRPGGTWRQ